MPVKNISCKIKRNRMKITQLAVRFYNEITHRIIQNEKDQWITKKRLVIWLFNDKPL
jgi:hypothetical protein